MKISHLKTNHVANPLGYALDRPTLSWIVEETCDTEQTAARVAISLDRDFQHLVFDSGKVEGSILDSGGADDSVIDSAAFRLAISLQPRTRYFWKVWVWGQTEHAESDAAWFETAKMGESWLGDWITPEFEDRRLHPILFRHFELPTRVRQARIYICGLGLYHLELNGVKVSDEYFMPYCNAYDQWIQYQTFDITALLSTDSNLVSVMLGNGWYKGRYGANGGDVDFYGDQFALICELHITMEDGSEYKIVTDRSWRAQPSPVLISDIFDGESYDARIPRTAAAFASESFSVSLLTLSKDRLEARRSLPVCVNEVIHPVALIHTPAGEAVLDMGQNFSGWVRFRTHAPAGTRIHLQFGEVLQNGNFFRDNLRTAKAEYVYIADGTDAIVEPYFTFFGFRYVKVSGWIGELNIDDFTGCAVYSRLDITGELETSNEKVNQLIRNVMWGQKGNFLDIPTDCPQRDERLGWTGDIQMFSGTACFNMDSSAFLAKYMYDLAKEQSKTGGMVPHIIPMANLDRGGSSAWGDAATIVPWTVYEFYGDMGILEAQYESMRAWVDYIRNIDEASGGKRLWTEGTHFGDWLALDGDDPTSRKGGTPEDFIASAFYCYSARIVAKAADVLGKTEDAQTYGALSNAIRAAIQQEYFTQTGRLAVPTQTGYVLALYMDLVPEISFERVKRDFIAKLEKANVHLRTGFVGTPYLCRVLSSIGASRLAYQLLLNEDYPSWLYAVNLGATTIWERWNSLNPDGSISSTSMNSLNHYAYGSIVEWIYRDVCGLNPDANHGNVAGFRHARITPRPDPALRWARARYRSAAGWYESGWNIDETGLITIQVSIPFNARASVYLQELATDEILLNGHPIEGSVGSWSAAQLSLSAGRYEIAYRRRDT